MPKRTPPFTVSPSAETSLSTPHLIQLVESWLLACDIAQHSERTLTDRRECLDKLIWFLRHRELERCGIEELRAFLHYVTHGHEEPGGRWGNPHMTRPTKPGRVKTLHSRIRAFFSWCVSEGYLSASPVDRIPTPVDRPDQVQPFTDDQVKLLLAAAKRSQHPARDEAILLLMLDTGMRAEEVVTLRRGDVDLRGSFALIEGKGGKARRAPFSGDTRKAIYKLMAEAPDSPPETCLFLSDRGRDAGGGLVVRGLQKIFERLGQDAGISGVRCSPHTLRHTFAISFLRAGGNMFTLRELLGHTSLAMTNRYVALAQADITRQHAQFSPVARLRGKKR